MKEKLIILGIDGLEYYLAEQFRLDAIKQKAYCKTDLSDYSIIVTPPIWASMIAGKIVEGVEKSFLRRQKIVGNQNIFKKILWKNLGDKILPKKIKALISSSIIFGNPFEATKDYMLKNYNEKTVFDFFEETWTNGIPSYGRNDNTAENRKLHRKAVEGDVEPYCKHVVKNYRKEKEKLLNIISNGNNYEMLFWYTTFLDSLGHIYITKKIKLMKYYFEINELVNKVKNLVPNASLYIISDHGMKKGGFNWGEHSDHGFFSSNTGELIQKPQDLFYLMKEKAQEMEKNEIS